jgi:acyl carrier protein
MTLSFQNIRDFLVEELAIDASDVTQETLLFSSGLVDSFALVTLMTFIENEGGTMIAPADVKLENFDSISRILNFLKQAA